MGLEKDKKKKKILTFEQKCKKHLTLMKQGFHGIADRWPVRSKEIKSYYQMIDLGLKNKNFTQAFITEVLDRTQGFLFLYKMISKPELKLEKLPFEVQLHSAFKELKKEINLRRKEKHVSKATMS